MQSDFNARSLSTALSAPSKSITAHALRSLYTVTHFEQSAACNQNTKQRLKSSHEVQLPSNHNALARSILRSSAFCHKCSVSKNIPEISVPSDLNASSHIIALSTACATHSIHRVNSSERSAVCSLTLLNGAQRAV